MVKNKVAVDAKVRAARCGTWDSLQELCIGLRRWVEVLASQALRSEFESLELMFKDLCGDRRTSGTCCIV